MLVDDSSGDDTFARQDDVHAAAPLSFLQSNQRLRVRRLALAVMERNVAAVARVHEKRSRLKTVDLIPALPIGVDLRHGRVGTHLDGGADERLAGRAGHTTRDARSHFAVWQLDTRSAQTGLRNARDREVDIGYLVASREGYRHPAGGDIEQVGRPEQLLLDLRRARTAQLRRNSDGSDLEAAGRQASEAIVTELIGLDEKVAGGVRPPVRARQNETSRHIGETHR